LVLPGNAVSVSLPGNKKITVREPRAPNRILLQDSVAGAAENKFILISPDPVAGLKFTVTTEKDFRTPKKP
jgi:hypothetical protein